MYVEREMRTKLNDLSKQVYGAPSAWMKYLGKGILVRPDEKEQAILNIESSTTGITYRVRRTYTPESLYELMHGLLVKMQESLIKKV